ncbi:MAG TPA: hypothetical protein VMW83_16815 [Spirochaetia bacterium]|nr:hypothetical protein [Spirochaetia bacterium]
MSRLKNNQVKKPKTKDTDVLIEKFPLHLSPVQVGIARALQIEAAKVWNIVCFIHRLIYASYHVWLGEVAMKAFVKGRCGVHSQSAQAIVETYFECCAPVSDAGTSRGSF